VHNIILYIILQLIQLHYFWTLFGLSSQNAHRRFVIFHKFRRFAMLFIHKNHCLRLLWEKIVSLLQSSNM